MDRFNINFSSKFFPIGEEEYSSSVDYSGEFLKKNEDSFSVTYIDEEENSVKIEIYGERQIIITRAGAKLSIVNGKTVESEYATPYGSLMLELFTKEIIVKADEETGEFYTDYTILNAGSPVSRNKITIKVTKKA